MSAGTSHRVDALVTDAEHRSAVAGLRGLGRSGLRVLALAHGRLAGGRWSRYAAARTRGPSSAEDPEAFLARLAELGGEHGPLVVYPGKEASLSVLIRRGEELPGTVMLPFPSGAPTERLGHKGTLAALAQEAGLEVPATFARAAVAELRGEELPLPLVVKSAKSKGALALARRVTSVAQFAETIHGLPPDEPLLVQEAAPGPLTAMAVVVDREGRLVARHQQTAERLWPLDAGGSSVAVSVPPDEELARGVVRLLATAGYWGLAHVQFVCSPRGPLVIDVNLRFYGTLPLALACGVNLPAAWQAVVTGGALPVPGPYQVGVRYRRLTADLSAVREGKLRPLLARVPRPRTGAMWAPDDPVPGALMALDTVRTRARA